MEVLGYLGWGGFCIAALWVGLRLARLWYATGGLPEGLAALALLGIGPIGFGCTVVSGLLPEPVWADALWAIASIGLNAGAAAAWAFTWLVFRPTSRTARAVVVGMSFALLACLIGEGVLGAFDTDQPASVATRVSDWLRTLALLWGAAEALRYRRQLARQARIGLADPEVMARTTLWGVALLAAGATGVVDSTVKLMVQRALDYPQLTLLLAAAGTVAAVCLWLAFSPRLRRAARVPA